MPVSVRAMGSSLPAAERELARERIDLGEPDAEVWARWIMRFFRV